MLNMALELFCGHCVADWALQTDFIATNKNRHTAIPGFWIHVLTAHAGIHGLFVYVATGSAALGLAEMAAHWLIDATKNEGWISLNTDQALHFACKGVWLWLVL